MATQNSVNWSNWFFLNIPGIIFKQAFGSNLTTGDTDIYTVPTWKKAFIASAIRAYNPSAWSITYFSQIKVSWVYYRLSANTTLTTWTGGAASGPTNWILLNAWESISTNTATTNWLNINYTIFEFSNNAPIYRYSNLALSNWDNTIYTVPAWKTANFFLQSVWDTTSGVAIANNTWWALNYILYSVPNWWAAWSTNQLYPATSISDKTSSWLTIASCLNAWDFIVVNASAWTAWQVAWMTVFEI